ncbi:MAG TPA: DUF2997 domain-containing protein [Chloroflexota bacterium]|jgi:hypothetical protein
MPEIEFTLDPTTGQLELHVTGIAGPACRDIAKLATELLGAPAREQNTPECFVLPQVRSQIRPKGSR